MTIGGMVERLGLRVPKIIERTAGAGNGLLNKVDGDGDGLLIDMDYVVEKSKFDEEQRILGKVYAQTRRTTGGRIF